MGTFVDMSLYPNLTDGLEIYGDGDGQTQFVNWAPIVGTALKIGTTGQTLATMSWRLHGLRFRVCATEYAFALNGEEDTPKVAHNNLWLKEFNIFNYLVNNTCNGHQFPLTPGQTRKSAIGGAYIAHLYSSYVDTPYCVVQTDAPYTEFNTTAGLTLKEVCYSTLSLRGLGSGGVAGNFLSPQPWVKERYPGWGVILRRAVYANTITQLHCEGSGGCVSIQGPLNVENTWTSAVMSMMQHVLISSTAPDAYNTFESVFVNRYPVKQANGTTACFSDRIEGPGIHIKHRTAIPPCPPSMPCAPCSEGQGVLVV